MQTLRRTGRRLLSVQKRGQGTLTDRSGIGVAAERALSLESAKKLAQKRDQLPHGVYRVMAVPAQFHMHPTQ
jgi:hypothetical protein